MFIVFCSSSIRFGPFCHFFSFPQFLQTFQKSLFGPCAPNCVQIVCLNCTVLSLVLSPNIGHKRNCVDKRGWCPDTVASHRALWLMTCSIMNIITSHLTWPQDTNDNAIANYQNLSLSLESTVYFWKNLKRVNNGDYIQYSMHARRMGQWTMMIKLPWVMLRIISPCPQLTNLVGWWCSKCTASVTPWQYLIITSDQRQHTALPAIRIPQI